MFNYLFDKEKSTSWKIINVLLLLSLVVYSIDFLTLLIRDLLPQNGDFSNFVLSEFLYDTFTIVSAIGIITGTLYLINSQINLFDKTYPVSRKILNFIFVLTIPSLLIATISYFFGKIFLTQRMIVLLFDFLMIKNVIAVLVVYLLGAYIINEKPILLSENKEFLNATNFISILVCLNSLMAFILIMLNFNVYYNAIDFIRELLLSIIPCVVFALVIYFLNFKKIITFREKPSAFNTKK